MRTNPTFVNVFSKAHGHGEVKQVAYDVAEEVILFIVWTAPNTTVHGGWYHLGEDWVIENVTGLVRLVEELDGRR